MTSVTALPYITAPESCWSPVPWFASIGDEPLAPVVDSVEPWDYAAHLMLTSSTSVDVDELRSAARVPSDTLIEFIVIVDCPAMNERRVAFRAPLAAGGDIELKSVIRFPPGTIAERITLERQVVLGEYRSVPPPLPARKGSILLRDVIAKSISLEADAGRFPVQLIDMSAIGFPDAFWILDLDTSDADRSFLGAARLFVNSGHPATDELLDRNSPRGTDLTSAMMWDVLRQLVIRSAVAGLVVGPDEEPESLGQVLWSLCHDHLGYDSLSDVAAALDSAPDDLEARIQSSIGLFR